MRVFVTGATGFIGSAIVQELLGGGHQVLGLARSDSSARQLISAGAEVHRGTLDDLESLRSGAASSDATIHLAFIHDFSKYKDNCEIDRQAIEAIGSGLTGSNRHLIITSGTAMLNPGKLATEEDMPAADSASVPRVASEEAAAAVAALGVKVSVIRLPPSVHGDGDHGFVPMLIDLALKKSISAYVGEGLNRWPAAHRLDVAHLYRLVLENGSGEPIFHGVAEEGIPFRQIAEVIGRRLNLPVVSMSPDTAAEHFGWFAGFTASDRPASSEQTRKRTRWQPKQPGLIADLEMGRYFESYTSKG